MNDLLLVIYVSWHVSRVFLEKIVLKSSFKSEKFKKSLYNFGKRIYLVYFYKNLFIKLFLRLICVKES